MLTPNFNPFPLLITQRLILRQLTAADAFAVQRLRSNEEVMKYVNRPLTLTIKDAMDWINVVIESAAENNGITWCICLKEDVQQLVATIGLWRIEKENHRAEIGYMLEPHLHGKGIMYEAIKPVIDYGFNTLQLHSIEAKLDPRNAASAALVTKAGFIQEGYFKENYLARDGFCDTAVYSLLTTATQKR